MLSRFARSPRSLHEPRLNGKIYKIYQNCRGLRILRSTIEPANSFAQFFLTVALLLSFFFQFLLKSGKGKSLVEEYDKYENTPLHVAAKKGYVRIVQVSSIIRVSLKAGTGPEHPPDGPDPSGNTLNYKNLARNYKTGKKKQKIMFQGCPESEFYLLTK